MNYGELTAIILFFIGVFGVVSRRNILKTVISLGIMDVAAILFFIASAGKGSQAAPIPGSLAAADPIPQALMITAIVIGIAVTAVSLTMFINLYHKYGTTNWNRARKMRNKE